MNTFRVRRSDWDAWLDRCEALGGETLQAEFSEGYDVSCVENIVVICDFSQCP